MSSKLQNKGPVCKITFGNMRQSQTLLYTLYINMFFVSLSAYIIEIYNTEVPDLAYFFCLTTQHLKIVLQYIQSQIPYTKRFGKMLS